MSDEKRKVIRGRTSPGHTLSQAVDFLFKIIDGVGEGPAARDLVCKALGHQSASGPALTKIGSLTHFGLLERSGGAYTVSPLGRRIKYHEDDTDRSQALAQAALEPSLYAEVVEAYLGKALPPLLPNILVQSYGVAPKNSNDVDQAIRETLEFAGLLRNGVVYDQPTQESGSRQHPTGADDEADVGVGDSSVFARPTDVEPRTTDRNGGSSYAIPLTRSRNATLTVPRPVQSTDLQRIKNWIDLMEDVLTELPDSADDQNDSATTE
ncbi:MAG: hypothetical protein AAFN41_08225 [Planctomycetota bacterium]